MSPALRASRARAQLTIMEPPSTVGAKPGGKLAQLTLQFNPSKLSLSKSTEWRRTPSRMAGQSALPEFVGSGPRSLSLEVFLDATATHDNSVEKAVEQLMIACVPTPTSLARKTPASPWVRFDWGTSRTTSFDGVLSNLSVSYTLFDVDGKPLRATCSSPSRRRASTRRARTPPRVRRRHGVRTGSWPGTACRCSPGASTVMPPPGAPSPMPTTSTTRCS